MLVLIMGMAVLGSHTIDNCCAVDDGHTMVGATLLMLWLLLMVDDQ